MQKIFFLLFFLFISVPAYPAELNVIATYPYIEDLTRKIGGRNVKVSSLARGDWDPHFIIPKPSLIARARMAELLIINGAQLEIGWLPPLIRQANNPEIQPGSRGFLDLSGSVEMLQVPVNVSRGQGDVHSQGNPHFHLDPYNIPRLANTITKKLCQLAPENCPDFQNNNREFNRKWSEKLSFWQQKLKKLQGVNILEYHRVFDYLLNRFGCQVSGTIEPLPGIPPTPRYLSELLVSLKQEPVKFNLRAVYHPVGPSEFISAKTGIKLVTLPHDIYSLSPAGDLFSLFDEIVTRLTD